MIVKLVPFEIRFTITISGRSLQSRNEETYAEHYASMYIEDMINAYKNLNKDLRVDIKVVKKHE